MSDRGKAEFNVMDIGFGVDLDHAKNQGLAQKPDIRKTLHKGNEFEELDSDTNITTKEPEGLVYKNNTVDKGIARTIGHAGIGALTGGAIGAAASDEGHRSEGALRGAAIGAVGGAIGGEATKRGVKRLRKIREGQKRGLDDAIDYFEDRQFRIPSSEQQDTINNMKHHARKLDKKLTVLDHHENKIPFGGAAIGGIPGVAGRKKQEAETKGAHMIGDSTELFSNKPYNPPAPRDFISASSMHQIEGDEPKVTKGCGRGKAEFKMGEKCSLQKIKTKGTIDVAQNAREVRNLIGSNPQNQPQQQTNPSQQAGQQVGSIIGWQQKGIVGDTAKKIGQKLTSTTAKVGAGIMGGAAVGGAVGQKIGRKKGREEGHKQGAFDAADVITDRNGYDSMDQVYNLPEMDEVDRRREQYLKKGIVSDAIEHVGQFAKPLVNVADDVVAIGARKISGKVDSPKEKTVEKGRGSAAFKVGNKIEQKDLSVGATGGSGKIPAGDRMMDAPKAGTGAYPNMPSLVASPTGMPASQYPDEKGAKVRIEEKGAHPGFEGAAREVSSEEGVPMKNAEKIIGASKAKASAAARRKNPRLNNTAHHVEKGLIGDAVRKIGKKIKDLGEEGAIKLASPKKKAGYAAQVKPRKTAGEPIHVNMVNPGNGRAHHPVLESDKVGFRTKSEEGFEEKSIGSHALAAGAGLAVGLALGGDGRSQAKEGGSETHEERYYRTGELPKDMKKWDHPIKIAKTKPVKVEQHSGKK